MLKHSPKKEVPSTLVIEDKDTVQAPWFTFPPPQKFFYPCQIVEPDLSKANLVSKVVVYKLSLILKTVPILIQLN